MSNGSADGLGAGDSSDRKLAQPQCGNGARIADRAEIARIISEAPEDVRLAVKRPPFSVKDAGSQFIGRREDVTQIVGEVVGVVQRDDVGANLPATVITGAPGVGKTTLLRHIHDALLEQGIGVLKLKAAQLESAGTFSTSVQILTESRLQAKLLSAQKITTEMLTRSADWTLNLGANIVRAIAQTANPMPLDLESPTIDIATATLQSWRAGKTPNPFAVLQTIRYMYPDGVAILIDEAQTLARFQPNPSETTCAGHVINSLATADGRRDANMDNAVILCAGLPDTVDVIAALGSFGTTQHSLKPLAPDHVRQLIAACIKEGAGANESLRQVATELWTEQLAIMYGDWTRHAAAAALSAKTALIKWGDRSVQEPWGWPAVVGMADAVRDRVYDHVKKQARLHKVRDFIRDVIAMALRSNNYHLAEEQLRDLIAAPLEEKWAKKPASLVPSAEGQEATIDGIIRGCKHVGLLDIADGSNPNVTEGSFYCPIPSLLTNLAMVTVTSADDMQRWLDAAGLNATPPELDADL